MPKEPGSAEQRLSSHDACEVLTGLVLEHLPSLKNRHTRAYAKGRNIWTPDQPADSLFFLVKGQVAVLVRDREGHETVVYMVDPGEPFGELCYCASGERWRQNYGRATTASQVIETPLDEFLTILQRNQELMNRFIFTFCERLTEAQRRIKVLASRNADARLGTLLLQLAALRGRHLKKNEGRVIVRATHSDLAQLAAMTRSHVTVTMGNFRSRGLIEYTRDRPIVINVPALRNYLDKRYPPAEPSS